MILVPIYQYENYIIPPATKEESAALETMIYCRETHDPCTRNCVSREECKLKAERK